MDSQFKLFMAQKKHIKMEPPGSSFSLISPPTTPSPPSVSSLSATGRNGSILSLAVPKRPRPYPALNREYSSRKEELASMSNSPAYASWSSTGRHPVERKPSDVDKVTGYATPQFMNGPYLTNMSGGSDLGSISSSSSLTGAMGESTTHSRRSSLPPNSSNGRRVYTNAQTHNVMWDNNAQPNMAVQNMNTSTYPTVSGHGSLSFTEMSSSLMSMDAYRNNPSPDSLSPQSPDYQGHPEHYGQGHPSTQSPGNNGMAYQSVSMSPYLPPSSPSNDHTDDEVHRLRRRVRELEIECSRNRSIIDSVRRPAAGLPTPSPSPSFQASWKARTEARKRIFCSLNRAGNALCSWHDSRRERRTYAPRQAPPGFLNCGCTYEQALFEESLSRNNVGSYHPGEAVRMDPALRNPLLRLLEKRYGYKDGDFERDPVLERWAEGESPSAWEQKAQSGPAIRRRTDSDRH